MKGISAQECAGYLAALAGLRNSCRLYDSHAHPYEVLFDRFSYAAPSGLPGVLSLPGRSYLAPEPGWVRLVEAATPGAPRSQRLIDISVMLLGRSYGSVGAAVFLDQMGCSGIGRTLLLPVAGAADDATRFERRMQWVWNQYAGDDRFWLAGSIPPGLAGGEIERYAASLKRRFAIRALKCHPVASAIDLGTAVRKQWLELQLGACRALRLPLILHGGRNNPFFGGRRGDFASLAHLREIDFSLAGEPVVLAHAGLHQLAGREVEQEALPLLNRMLDRHPNLYVDISGLAFETLKLVLAGVDRERILFGSDALYCQQWEALVTTAHALRALGSGWEEGVVQIAGVNPARTIFRESEPSRPERAWGQPVARGDAAAPPRRTTGNTTTIGRWGG